MDLWAADFDPTGSKGSQSKGSKSEMGEQGSSRKRKSRGSGPTSSSYSGGKSRSSGSRPRSSKAALDLAPHTLAGDTKERKERALVAIMAEIKEHMGVDSNNMAETLNECLEHLGLPAEGTMKEKAHRAASELGIPIFQED